MKNKIPHYLPAGLFDLLAGALLVLMVFAIVVARAPYLHDFAEWLYQGQVVRLHLTSPAAVAGFTLAPYPVPNSLVTALLGALSLVLAPLWAGKAFLIFMLLAWFAVIRQFTRRFVAGRLRAPAGLVLFALCALATFFWYGFVSYQLALMLLTWFFAVYKVDTRGVVVAAFGLAIFFAHAMVFLVFGLVIGVRLLLQWNHATVKGLVPATACSLWFLAGRHIAQVEPQKIDATWSGLREALIYKAGYPAMLGPFRNFILPNGSSLLENHAWLYWLGFGVNFAVAGVLAILVLAVLKNYLQEAHSESPEAPQLRRAWAVSMLLIILFYIIAPYHFFGLVNAGGRVLIPLLLLAFMLGGKWPRPCVRIVLWPVVVFTFLSAGSYLYLMDLTRQAGFSPRVQHPAASHSATGSVLNFNRQLYAATRYTYFNYRLFAFARHFDQISSARYQGLTFRHGMLIRFEPDDQQDPP